MYKRVLFTMNDCVNKKLLSEETFKEMLAQFQRYCNSGSEDEENSMKASIFPEYIIFYNI